MFIPNLLSAESGSESIVRARIIVVEDEPDLREAVAEYLGASGYEVATADSAAAARSLLETQSFHLAILDIAMRRFSCSSAMLFHTHDLNGYETSTTQSKALIRRAGL